MSVTRLPGTEKLRPIVQPVADPDLPVEIEEDRGPKPCSHRHVEVTTERRVLCKDCEVFIDPVDYIITLARDWERYRKSFRQHVREARGAMENLGRLRAEETRTKNRLKAAIKRGTERGVLTEDESMEIRRRAGLSMW